MSETQENGQNINVGKKERAASLAAGGALVLYGLSKRNWVGGLVALAGSALVHRGATGHCYVCDAMGKKGATEDLGGENEKSKDIPGHGGILVTRTVTINKSPEELYSFWRKLENLPQFMNHLESVEEKDETHSHWVAKAPAGSSVSWDAEIVRDNPNELIAWRSTEDSTVPNSGSVRFVAAPEGRGTEVKVNIEYQPPAGVLGAVVAKLFGEEPQQQVNEDLLRFKQLMEAGEVATNGREDTDGH